MQYRLFLLYFTLLFPHFVGTFLGALVFDYFSGTSQLSSGDASDSICPKGWGMAGLEGNESYQRLIANVYGMNKTNIITTRNYKEYKTITNLDNIVLQKMLSLAYSGIYFFERGERGSRLSHGYFWEKTIVESDITRGLAFTDRFVRPRYADYLKGGGYSIRCVAKSFLSLAHPYKNC